MKSLLLALALASSAVAGDITGDYQPYAEEYAVRINRDLSISCRRPRDLNAWTWKFDGKVGDDYRWSMDDYVWIGRLIDGGGIAVVETKAGRATKAVVLIPIGGGR